MMLTDPFYKPFSATQQADNIRDAIGSPVWLDNVAAVLADTDLVYSGAGTVVSAGDYVRTKAEGFSYEVAASGATDHHVTTAGGVKLKVPRTGGGYDLRAWGVVPNDASAASANRAAVQKAIDQGNADAVRTVLTCPGIIPVDDELFIKTHAVGAFLTFNFLPSAPNKACCNVGTKDGAYLVRTGGWVGCVVDATSTTETGTVGFSMGHGARACFIENGYAVMNNNGGAGSTTIDYGHIGFQMLGVRADLVVSLTGAYQNKINGSVFNARRALFLDTEGYGVAGYAPEMNGNQINIAAFSCRTTAVYIGEGAQENTIKVRADSFVSQIGQGTTITIADVRGSYNRVEVDEEIGVRGDTQYTVAFNGDAARYNMVEYQTQQVVTSAVVDNTTGSAVGKNVARLIGRPQSLQGGDTFSISGFSTLSAGAAGVVSNSAVISRPCILTEAVAENLSTPASYTRFYFAKNGVTNTTNRLTWGSGDAAGTRKTLITDTTASGTINSNFVFEDGDVVDAKFDQDATGGNSVRWTLFFKVLR